MAGSDLFVVNSGDPPTADGKISEYTLSGVPVATVAFGLKQPYAVALSGSDLFFTYDGGAEYAGTIGEYTTSGVKVNASLISGLDGPFALAVSGSDLFVASDASPFLAMIGEYTTSGATINSSLISGVPDMAAIAVSGSDLFVASQSGIAEYTTSGATVNASLVPGVVLPTAISVAGPDLFIASGASNGRVGEYTTSGATVNASLISGLYGLTQICVDQSQVVGTPTQLAFGQQPGNIIAGKPFSPAVTVVVEDRDGEVVSTDDSTITLSIASGPSGLLGGTITAPAVDGVATFSGLSPLTVAGTYKLGASDGALSGVSGSFTVDSAAPADLAFFQNPTPIVAGETITPAISVSLTDAFGNRLNGLKVKLAIASGPAGARLEGTLNVASDDGLAVFSDISLTQAGLYTLKATRGSAPPAVSMSFLVIPAAAAQLTFVQQPTDVTAGEGINPAVVVEYEDQFGNLDTDQNGTITVSIKTGPAGAVLSGMTTMATVNGAATFPGLSLIQAGAFKLAASDGALNGKSAKFSVIAAAPAGMDFVQEPSPVVAGQDIKPAISVAVADAFGNPVTGANVRLSIASGPAGAILAGTLHALTQNGVATFSDISLAQAGTYKLDARRGSLALATSSAFSVNPGAATQLGFVVEPASSVAGLPLAPPVEVDVEDSFGNLVTGDNSDITLAIRRGPAGTVLGGTLMVAAIGGEATFSDLVLDAAGSYKLVAGDGTLAPAKSAQFTVSQGS
ncbi:MAG: hypothetical protein ABSH22_02845 [Tepidisphaeraceae bacterium]